MVGRDVEVVVVLHIVHEPLGAVREIPQVDDELHLFFFRTGENLVQPVIAVMGKHAWIVVNVGKRAKLDGGHGLYSPKNEKAMLN
jgi:hypothetical protein